MKIVSKLRGHLYVITLALTLIDFFLCALIDRGRAEGHCVSLNHKDAHCLYELHLY